MAGQADVAGLEASARIALESAAPAESKLFLALACRAAGRAEIANRLWASLDKWKPEGTEILALHLTAKLAFGSSYQQCREEESQLLACRKGREWENTKATSAAIDALAGMVSYTASEKPTHKLKVIVGGRTVLDLSDPAGLKKLTYRVHLPAGSVPQMEGLPIEMITDDQRKIYYTLAAKGTQKQDKLEPTGDVVKLNRSYERLDGKPLVGSVQPGEVVTVRLTLVLASVQEYMMVEDRRPSGCEYTIERLQNYPEGFIPANVEFRDDRVCIFFTSLPAGRHEVIYTLRAETAGVIKVLPGCAYPMYADKLRGETGAAELKIGKGE